MSVVASNGMRERKTMTSYTDTESSGISSSDTRRSSIRCEPVPADQGYNPPSPGHHDNRNDGRSSRCLAETDSELDDVDNDVIPEEEILLSSRHRDSPPANSYRLQPLRRGTAFAPRSNADILYHPKPSTSYEPRQHSGLPRIGTGVVPVSGAPSSYLQPTSIHSQQEPSAVMATRVANSSLPDTEFFPVVTTTLKLAHEEGDEGWSYRGRPDPDRSQFCYPSSGIPAPSHGGPVDKSDNTATRFMNKPVFGARSQFEPPIHHRTRDARTCNGTYKHFKKRFPSRCSWKTAAITFIVITILLFLALISTFIHFNFFNPTISTTEDGSRQCLTGSDTTPDTSSVNINPPQAVLQLKRKTEFIIPPNSFLWMQMYVEEPLHLKFNFTVSPGALLAVYGRKGLKPSHTKFDFFERIEGNSLPMSRSSTSFMALSTTSDRGSRKKRSTTSTFRLPTEFIEYLDAGTWHLALFNDLDEEDSIELITSISEGLSKCPNSCNSNGDCMKGVCQCFNGFQGSDCSQVSCTVTCRGNGAYAQGRCVCFSGWKGVDCGTPADQCLDPECGGHGQCVFGGECVCEKGYKGETCSDLDCYDSSCSGHGVCLEGVCRCDRGWKGTICSDEDLTCRSNCAGHGTYDLVLQKCNCEPGWSGTDCSLVTCRPSCDSAHGVCVDGRCRCEDGWTGEACDMRQCHSRCDEHGRCIRGLCVCDAGWNGELCTFAGCPDDCSGNGNCESDTYGNWYCTCGNEWKGPGCSIMVEVSCGDGKDNDLDTLIDCQDPDCCSLRSCSRTSQCRGGLDPSNEVTNSQGRSPTLPTASFFDRVKFLVHRNGVQINSALSVFEPRRASVIRGQVLTTDGSPLVGVHVQVQNLAKYGSTKTRFDGWFDLLINGGGSVELGFQRPSFLSSRAVVYAPWNEFVVIPTVTMRTPREPDNAALGSDACDVSLLMPPSASILVSSVRAFTAAECSEKGSIVPEIQAIREAINLPSTKSSVVYLSSRASGYKSIIHISLIDGEKPPNLLEIEVQITVLGKRTKKKFEPISNLKYTYEWNREDAYRQKVYGTVSAEVLVGYRYDACSKVVWKKLKTTVRGHDPSLGNAIASWSLDIHHTYFAEEGVVYLGNGGEMRLQDQPPMISTVMGDGELRHVTCADCDGPARSAQLLSPVALTSDKYGNIYIGDHDFIRKLDTSGNVSSLFSTRNPPTKYFMAVSPADDGLLYFSDPVHKRIYKLRRMSLGKNRRSRDLSTNQVVVAGTGASCYPLQEDNCGDGGSAISARLSSPKGLALDAKGRLYFVDGSRIRTIDPESEVIETLAGNLLATGTRPLQCEGSMSLDQLELNYPTDLAINPQDGVLFVLDGDVIVKIDLKTRHVSLLAGVPPHCARNILKNADNRDARKVHLISPTSITLSTFDGSIFVSETDQSFVHRVRRIDPYSGRIATVAGIDSKCDCAAQECQCFAGDGDFARSASLHNPISITATPDGSVYVADQLNLRIRKISQSLPINTNNQFQVTDPDSNQLYVFDSHGRHLKTKNVITNTLLYRFSHSSEGALNSVTDVNNNALTIQYSASGHPQRIVLPNRDVITLAVNEGKYLTEISKGTSILASFTYHNDGSGLIRSSVRGRYSTTFYVYDARGRLMSMTSSTGVVTTLHMTSNRTSHTVTMKTIATSAGDQDESRMGVGRRDVVIATQPGYLCDVIITTEGAMRTTYKRWTDNSISVHYLDNSELILETKPHPVLGLTAPSVAKRTIQLPADPLENKIEWKTRKEAENGPNTQNVLLGRRMRVNDRNILSLDYSQGLMMEKIYDDHTKFMLRVKYNDKGLPTLWIPNSGITPVNVTYDDTGHAVTWQRGSKNEQVTYDSKGNIKIVRLPDGSQWTYNTNGKIYRMGLPGTTAQYTYTHDDAGGLERLTLPSGASYHINRMLGVGFMRITISDPDGAFAYMQDQDDHGNILSAFHPGEKRKAIFRYDVHGHMTKIVHDSSMTNMMRDTESGELVSVTTDDCVLRFHRNGPLVQRHVITSTENGGLLATFQYTHDVNLRLSSLAVRVNSTELPVEHFSYNDVSGKLTTFGSYRIIDMFWNVYTIGNEFVTLSKRLDNFGRIIATWLRPDGIVFNMQVQYNNGGRVSSRVTKFGIHNGSSSYKYYYDEAGALVRVDFNKQVRWRYRYDVDGKMESLEDGSSRRAMRYDEDERLTSFGDVRYVFDKDGFLEQKGQEVFQYNSIGHLTKAYKLDNSYEINYGYDGFGRLTTRVDVIRNNVVRFLYADVNKPAVLTHIFNLTSGHVITFRYDVEGHLFALDRSDGMMWSVVCDQVGTPIGVLDRANYVVKEMRYTPFGQLYFDSNPYFVLHIGYRGGIYDADTGLVHFIDRDQLAPLSRPQISSAKPLGPGFGTKEKSIQLYSGVDYDPAIGQFTSSGIKRIIQLDVSSLPLRLYQVNDPVNLSPKYNHMTDTRSWLSALRFKLQNVAPDPHIATRQKDKSSAECQLSRHLSAYMNLQTSTPSVLVPQSHSSSIAGGAMFAKGLVISVDRGQIATKVTDSATDDVKRFSSVVSGGQVLVGRDADSSSAPMSLTHEGKPVLYLTKPSTSFAKDKQTMRVTSNVEKTLRSSYDQSSDVSSSLIALRLRDNEMRAESGYALVVIFYVSDGDDAQLYDVEFSTVTKERDRVITNAHNRAESDAWLREKQKIKSGLRTRWSNTEKQEILTQGKASNYAARPIWNADVYPELADSGRDVTFVKT